MEFGEKLKKEREVKGMTQQTLADQLYVTRQAVSRWECGARYPDLLTTKCIAKILDVSIDSLVSDDEMKDFSEKQALIDTHKEGKVMTCVYALSMILAILACLPYVANFLIQITSKDMEIDSFGFFYYGIQILSYAGVVVLAGICTKVSYKKDIDAKFAGYVGAFFYGLYTLRILVSNWNYGFENGKFAVGALVAGAFSVLWYCFAIVLIGMYFIKKKNKLAKLVYLVNGMILAYDIANFMYQMFSFVNTQEWNIYQLLSQKYLAELFAKAAIISTMIVQAMILEKKRKRMV